MGCLGGGSSKAPSETVNNVTGAATYVPKYQKQDDTTLNTDLANFGSSANNANGIYAQLQALTQQYGNNPYATGAQTGANNAGAMAANLAGTEGTLGNQLIGQGGDLGSYAAQILNMGLDPQNALYNQQYQQTTDQANAINSEYGLGSSAAGAGVVDQDLNNFNIGWQNNQLDRATQAAGAAQSLDSAQSGLDTAGNSFLSSAVTNTQQAGNLPYAQYGSNLASELSAYSDLQAANTSATGVPQQAIADLQNYLGYGVNAGNAGAANAQTGFSDLQGIGSDLLGGLASSGAGSSISSGLGSLFGSGAGGAVDGFGQGIVTGNAGDLLSGLGSDGLAADAGSSGLFDSIASAFAFL